LITRSQIVEFIPKIGNGGTAKQGLFCYLVAPTWPAAL